MKIEKFRGNIFYIDYFELLLGPIFIAEILSSWLKFRGVVPEGAGCAMADQLTLFQPGGQIMPT